MGALLVVDPLPSLRFDSCLIERTEAMRVEDFVSQRSVEALDEGVLCWLARLNELPCHALGFDPRLQQLSSELRTVVAADDFWNAVQIEQSLEHPLDAFGAEAEVNLDFQRITRVVVDDVQQPIRPAPAERIAHEVHRPALQRTHRLQQRLTHADRQASTPTAAQLQPQLVIQALSAFVIDRKPLAAQLLV